MTTKALDVLQKRHELAADEAALRAEVARLRTQLAERERAVRELTEAVAARDEFLAVAAHELRNPMGAIAVGVTSLLQRTREDLSVPDVVRARLEKIDRITRAFVRRATTLLDVSRIASGKLSLDRRVVDLSALVAGVVHELELEAERSKCAITMRLDACVTGWWDGIALEQVAVNLVSNAIKYGAGGPIVVTLVADERRASLSVEDRGIGISETDCARIFDRFERVAGRGAPRSGFGVGLWIAREVVSAHGGELSVESTLGVGSIFTATLPRGIEECR